MKWIIVLMILAYGAWWGYGIPLTHDSQMNIARMANFYLAVKDGMIPPPLGTPFK